MKCFKIWASLMVIGLLSLPQLYAADAKYAFINVAKIFDDYTKTQDNNAALQEAGKKKEQEREVIVHDIRQIKDELALLNDNAKTDKQELLDGKLRDLQEFDQKAKRELGEDRNKMIREIFKDIDDTVQRYGERKGYDMIFSDRALLYQNSKFDITEDVLKELNKNYKKK